MRDLLRSASARSPVCYVSSLFSALLLTAGLGGCGRIGVEVLESTQEGVEGADAASDQPEAGEDDALDAALPDDGADDASIEEASAPDANVPLDAAFDRDGAVPDAMSMPDGVSGDAASVDAGICASNPGAYVPNASCGVGYCRQRNTPSRCANGAEVACSPSAPRSASDSSCDGVDDDCDGNVDEDYVATATSCGRGVCARSGMARCVNGAVRDSCVAAEPTSSSDDASGYGNGLDDDCDGQVDEDIPGCDTEPLTFEAGNHTNITVPPGCGRVTVRLWGAGGASGHDLAQQGASGDGGAGGYASSTTAISGSISLLIGQGGASGCDAAGVNAGSASYNGGSGGSATGAPGADGMISEGGAGAVPSAGSAGGRGHFGGGGGGQGSSGPSAGGNGGGGGAASVLIMNGMRAVVAAGGGGGGGAGISTFGSIIDPGGNGGGGCSGIGQVEAARGGGGGGGGVCDGFATHLGTGVTPAFSADVPSGSARGGSGAGVAGGTGYAILTFSR